MNISMISKTDGPTSIFLAGKLGVSWINVYGLILMVLILLPNIIYVFKFRDINNLCKNKIMNIMEQVGRYVSMFLMVFNIGLAEFGFYSVNSFLIYTLGNIALLLVYWSVWFMYFKKKETWKSLILAIIPTMIFFISGVTLRHILLIISSVIFGIGHIYVTYQNSQANNDNE